MTRRIVLSYFLLTLIALALLAIPLGLTFAKQEKNRLLFDVEKDADAIATALHIPNDPTSIDARDAELYATRTGGTVIVVDTQGQALVDTAHAGDLGRDYSTRPEIQGALAGRREVGTRSSETAGTTLVYAAVPIADGGEVVGALRITFPTATLYERVRHVWGQVALLCFGILVTVMIVGFVLARTVTKPVRELENATDRFAAGEFSARVREDAGPPELRHLAARFNRMAAQTEQLIGAQQRFVADASHQLRTPLTALRLRVENLEASTDAADRASITAIAAEIDRMSHLVDGLLLLARQDGSVQQPGTTDLAEAVRERVDAWTPVARERTVALVAEGPERAPARALPGAVDQIIDNLVDNALRVSPPGTSVRVRVVVDGETVVLHVVDAGPGLDKAARTRAFDRFWRAPNAPPGGSGLGLAIVRRLVEASGGTVRLDPAEDGGIDAVVRLPLGRAPLPNLLLT
jgi:signal transduction histidine kinase